MFNDYLNIFKRKLFDADPFSDKIGKILKKNIECRPYLEAATVARLLVDNILQRKKIFALENHKKLSSQNDSDDSVSSLRNNSLFKHNDNQKNSLNLVDEVKSEASLNLINKPDNNIEELKKTPASELSIFHKEENTPELNISGGPGFQKTT